MSILNPKLSILDETDSGLDIDALRVVADGVNSLRKIITLFNNYSLPKIVRLYKARFCSCIN